MKAYERLLKYAVMRTPSDGKRAATPTTKQQFDLARLLVTELKELGVDDVTLSDECFVYAKLPATPGLEDKRRLGLIAHMDTVSQYCDHDIRPQLTPNYDGKDLPLGTSGRTLTVRDFPHLPSLRGRTLITSDGTTILGVDDKAGIAEIMTTLEIIRDKSIAHGPLRVAFTPDEETGTGASHFDVEHFDAEVAYTLDGDTEGEIQYQNFNACEATFEFRGVSVHPGSAKDVMVNAVLLALEANNMLPGLETPRYTEGYEGFFHLMSMKGDESLAELRYIIRDHDREKFEEKKRQFQSAADRLNEKYRSGGAALEAKLTDSYYNMKEKLEPYPYLIDCAKEAFRSCGVKPETLPIRGGTDGAKLSFMGLPCPNLSTGGENYHGIYEYLNVNSMEKMVEILKKLTEEMIGRK